MSAVEVVFDVFALVMALLFLAIGLTIFVRNSSAVPRIIGAVVAAAGAGLAFVAFGLLT